MCTEGACKTIVLLALGLNLAMPLQAANLLGVEVPGLELQFGYDFILNSVDDSAPNPVISNSFGASVPLVVSPNLVFRPEVSAFFQSMQYLIDRPVPVEAMYDNVSVMVLVASANLGYEFPVLKTLTVVPEVGVAFALRLPVGTAGTGATEMVLPLTAWYLAGRFLYPEFGLGMLYQFSDRYTLFVRVQGMEPVFNLWSNLLWWDQLVLTVNLGLRFAL
jgi:hypothetical protein